MKTANKQKMKYCAWKRFSSTLPAPISCLGTKLIHMVDTCIYTQQNVTHCRRTTYFGSERLTSARFAHFRPLFKPYSITHLNNDELVGEYSGANCDPSIRIGYTRSNEFVFTQEKLIIRGIHSENSEIRWIVIKE